MTACWSTGSLSVRAPGYSPCWVALLELVLVQRRAIIANVHAYDTAAVDDHHGDFEAAVATPLNSGFRHRARRAQRDFALGDDRLGRSGELSPPTIARAPRRFSDRDIGSSQ